MKQFFAKHVNTLLVVMASGIMATESYYGTIDLKYPQNFLKSNYIPKGYRT